MVDLGDWWEIDTGLPIPLGAILARRCLGPHDRDPTGAIRASVEHAWKDPAASAAYVAEHADEMDPDVQQRHIALYVNEFTRDLGDEGYAAVEALLMRAAAAGLVPPSTRLCCADGPAVRLRRRARSAIERRISAICLPPLAVGVTATPQVGLDGSRAP